MSENFDDTFLARWLNNELTEEERKAFEESEDFKKYQKIIAATENIERESFDEEMVLQKIKAQTSQKASVSGKTTSVWWWSAAAAVAIIFAAFLFFYHPTTEIKTGYGEISEVVLPDGSKVMVNANSQIEFNEDKWNENRVVTLNGEAFFDVEKGMKFTVSTSSGQVSVLGTEFNVSQLNGYFFVACYEGRVLVESGAKSIELSPGMMVQISDDKVNQKNTDLNSPAWLSDYSEFDNAPINYVFLTLENQYGVKVRAENISEELTFSGRFPNDDLNTALEIISGSLGIEYEQKQGEIIFTGN
ncbi:FecR family protein [Mangrovivirga cuniculi]|uniref:FecR family protein n=1 Tax=Mangrovivirga cuniculi TaxID=2715131 RepID=A0A4D7JWU2_9BACT|nr:FecR domain-containing protein [Mangrovivirga cuniculi]QCK16932.1 hypothetical protein DCC35_20455 [Mangrovivirga cuniculi]